MCHDLPRVSALQEILHKGVHGQEPIKYEAQPSASFA